jgi:hypothetical protein
MDARFQQMPVKPKQPTQQEIERYQIRKELEEMEQAAQRDSKDENKRQNGMSFR